MSHRTIFRLDMLLYNIEWEENNLKHEKRVSSIYGMFQQVYSVREIRKIGRKLEGLQKEYNDLIKKL